MTTDFFQNSIEPQFFEVVIANSNNENPHLDTAYSQDIHSSDVIQLDAMMAKMPDVFHAFFELEAA